MELPLYEESLKMREVGSDIIAMQLEVSSRREGSSARSWLMRTAAKRIMRLERELQEAKHRKV